MAEILAGIERLSEGRRKEVLRSAAAEIFEVFAEQVLPFDAAAAEQYALVVTQRDGLGLADFRKTGVEVINPWQARS